MSRTSQSMLRGRGEQRRSVLGGLPFASVAFASIATACAGLMGVEEATPRDPTSTDGGPTSDDGSTRADTALEEAGCVGAGCPCSGDSTCKHPVYGKCVGGVCQACSTSPDSCGVGRFCLAGTPGANELNECAPGCSSDESCRTLSPAAPFCELSRHQCVACRTNADCTKPNQECSLPAGKCADKCTSNGGTCPNPNEVCCNQLCVDPKEDIGHCGGCGKACGSGQTLCCEGVCANPLTETDHCGSCGFACSETNGSPSCTAGTCKWSCDPGYHHCSTGNTGCETSTSSNVTRCGSCTNDCNATVENAGEIACVASKCTYAGQCTASFADCDGNKANGCECPCGRENQPCCANRQCGNGLVCDGADRCVRCGAKDQPCCAGATCSGDTRCEAGTCRACLGNNAKCSAPGASTECCSGYCKQGPGASGMHRCGAP